MKCIIDGCKNEGKTLAFGREMGRLGYVCEEHADELSDEGCPEYNVSCPCCGCEFGVN